MVGRTVHRPVAANPYPLRILDGSVYNPDDFTTIDGEAPEMKKVYEKPAVIHTEKSEARAVACIGPTAKATSMDCPQGPVSS